MSYKKSLHDLIHRHAPLRDIITAAHDQGARAYLVGGAVRDLLLGRTVKDCDVELHNIDFTATRALLEKFGTVFDVGASFGVLKISTLPTIDWSLPRRDAAGRKPEVTIDPTLTIEEALRRRDVTFNSMAIDLYDERFIDPFGGKKDLEKKILRATDLTLFAEDPLRLYRVMQFSSRFDATPDEALNTLCATMSLGGISRERIEEELKKLLLLSERPSRGLRWLQSIGRMRDLFPEIAVLVDTPQNPHWHPEGSVFEHTMQSVDAAALIMRGKFKGAPFYTFSERDALVLMYATLCHDVGKAVSTEMTPRGISSHGHDVAGESISRDMLKRIMSNQDLLATVPLLVRHHLAPGIFAVHGATPAAYKRLALKLSPHTSLQMLGHVALADRAGRNPEEPVPFHEADHSVIAFFANASAAQVLKEHEQPLLLGRDLLEVISEGPLLGELLKRAYELQLEEGIDDKERLKERVLAEYARSMK